MSDNKSKDGKRKVISRELFNSKNEMIVAGALAGILVGNIAISNFQHFRNFSIDTVVNGLASPKIETSVDENIEKDENLLGVSVEELDNAFEKAYQSGDGYTCNKIIAELGNMIIKAEILESMNFDRDLLQEYSIVGMREHLQDGNQYKDHYWISMKYNDEYYEFTPTVGLPFKLCSVIRAAEKNQLVFKNNNYFQIDKVYNLMKRVLARDVKTKHEGQIQEHNYVMKFGFVKDSEKTNAIEKYMRRYGDKVQLDILEKEEGTSRA